MDNRSPSCESSIRHIDVSGLTYTTLNDVTWQDWVHILRYHTSAYQPQPYQQFATVQKAAGDERDARRVLIAQQEDLRNRGLLGGRPARTVHRIWGFVGSYGYRAHRLALVLLVVLVAAGALGSWAGHWVTGAGQHAAQHTSAAMSPGTPCSTLEQIGLGIDRGLPLGSIGVRTYCDLNTATTAGQWFTLGIWIVQAAVWALATLAIAGYTGLIRKVI